MWTAITIFVALWVICGLPIAFMYCFNEQIIAILEAYTEYIKTQTRILQEVNRQCNNPTQ